jgi:tyrosine-protein kinase Etk/Wzc
MTEHQNRNATLDLLSVGLMLARRKRIVLLTPVLISIAAVLISFLLPKTYLGVTRIIPPQNQSMALQIVTQLGAASGALAGGALGLKSPGDMYVGVLQGTAIADRLIRRFDLMKRYDEGTLGDTRAALDTRTDVYLSREGLIVISVQDQDPSVAAQIANAYVEELQVVLQNMAIAEGTQKRSFFERQLAQTRSSLASAELQLKSSQERTGTIILEEQGKVTIEAAALLRAQVAAKDVELSSLRLFATPQNPSVRKAEEEMRALQRELAKIEGSGGRNKGDLLLSTGTLPEQGLEYVRRLRDVKYYEALLEMVAKQYELSRLEEARDFAIVSTVDSATPPDIKHKPKRVLIGAVSFLLGLIAAVAAVVVIESRTVLLSDPVRGPALRELERTLGLRHTRR